MSQSSSSSSSSSSGSYTPAPSELSVFLQTYSQPFCIVLTALSFALSIPAVALLIKRRKTFPLNLLDVKTLVANELTIPLQVWGYVSYYVDAENTPCWFVLLTWDGIYFPITAFLVYCTVRLWADSRSQQDADAGKRKSFLLRHRKKLQSKGFLIPFTMFLWIESWTGVLPTIFALPSLSIPSRNEECDQTDLGV